MLKLRPFNSSQTRRLVPKLSNDTCPICPRRHSNAPNMYLMTESEPLLPMSSHTIYERDQKVTEAVQNQLYAVLHFRSIGFTCNHHAVASLGMLRDHVELFVLRCRRSTNVLSHAPAVSPTINPITANRNNSPNHPATLQARRPKTKTQLVYFLLACTASDQSIPTRATPILSSNKR